jgi:pimeloyl-ACP methyl ester carboxylesterase
MTTVFKTAQSRDNIRARYNQILGAFPFAQKYVDTAFGRTFVLENGDPGKETLILLHGSCSNSAFWFGEICALSDRFHVFAADIIGEAGNSNENRPKLNSDGYADWLREVLDALGIKKAVVAGNSLGGWLALKFAAKYPQRVLKLILIAASGLSGQSSDLLNKAQNAVAQMIR